MYQVTPEEIQKAMAEVMSKKLALPNVAADSIMIETKLTGQFYRIAVRLNSTYKVLPTPDQVIKTYNQTGQKGEGAKLLMFGAVQVVGNQLRASTRIVRTETSEILKASVGDAETSYEGLVKAFEIALLRLNIAYVC